MVHAGSGAAEPFRHDFARPGATGNVAGHGAAGQGREIPKDDHPWHTPILLRAVARATAPPPTPIVISIGTGRCRPSALRP